MAQKRDERSAALRRSGRFNIYTRRATYSSLLPILLVLAVLGAFSVGAGLYLHGQIAASLQASEQIRQARADAFAVIRGQLDEETGLRGYAATGDSVFLEPYRFARAVLPRDLAHLRAQVSNLDISRAAQLVDETGSLNREWLATVADPILRNRATGATLQLRGKSLVDRFRAAMNGIDALLDRRERSAAAHIQNAITRIVLLLLGVILVLLIGTMLFALFQARLSSALERERNRSELQREEAAALRAAYQTEKHIADTLQEAFVQRPLPAHPSLHFSAMYTPAAEESKVGGDWYDALEISNNHVLFAIGDVAGHGIGAAVGMNRARQAMMSSALAQADPASILARVNAELLQQDSPMVTALVGFADPHACEFSYATAGHPPPVLLEPGRPPRLLHYGGLPLGVFADAQYSTQHVQSVPGATLVLYTDGAVEHSHNVIEGEQLLLRAVSQAGFGQQADPAAAIHHAIFAQRSAGDDVAILTVGFAGTPLTQVRVSADRADTGLAARIATSR